MRKSLRDQIWQRIRAAYYAFDLGRFPGGHQLGKHVHLWEAARGFGDSPKHVATWDREYACGAWTYMARAEEISRYSAVIGYMESLRGDGAFLDVGCGDGVLFNRFRRYGYTRYVGIDISEVALANLAEYNDGSTSFVQADGDSYEPSESFDVIVFNESLYYLRDPITSLLRYANALKPSGSIVVSTYTASRRSLSVLRDAKRSFHVVDETKTIQGGHSWLCTVIRPR